ncbi:MAG: hypothetical protein DCC73_11940 [Proteobacteria bacterium]|nr:MAG: hypothetical protein DCC73_11940 [Pseudomonadota bacterium]
MTVRQALEINLARVAGGLPVGDFTPGERMTLNVTLARRSPGFSIAAGRSKAQVIGDLVEFLLARQVERRR